MDKAPVERCGPMADSFDYCTGVWNADPECCAWSKQGHPFHGCEMPPPHKGGHQCRCGDRAGRWETLPDPRPGRTRRD